jgi:hypothetical protein
MQNFAKGVRVWSDHQAEWLPWLRSKTLRDKSDTIQTLDDRMILFIEPRCHPATEFVLRNIRHFCSWPILIVHGTENELFMKDIAGKIKGTFHFLSTRTADLPNPSYNTLFTTAEFWESFPCRWILIMQTDTMLMRNADATLQSFIDRKLSYVGAPWNYSCTACQAPIDQGCGHMIDQRVVASLAPDMIGNGGMCFRDKNKILAVLQQYKLDAKLDANVLKAWKTDTNEKPRLLQLGCTNEDVFYAKSMREMPDCTFPSRLEALDFAVEQIGPVSWPAEHKRAVALGCHKPWVYLPPNLVRGILSRAEYALE